MDWDVIVTILSSGAVSALIGSIVAGIQSKNSVRNGLKQVLYFSIKKDCVEAIARGYIDNSSLEALHESWQTYHNDLGGNGYLDALMDRVGRLEIRN